MLINPIRKFPGNHLRMDRICAKAAEFLFIHTHQPAHRHIGRNKQGHCFRKKYAGEPQGQKSGGPPVYFFRPGYGAGRFPSAAALASGQAVRQINTGNAAAKSSYPG